MIVYLFILSLFFSFSLRAGEEKRVRTLYAYLSIGDYAAAVMEAERGIQLYPDSKPLYLGYIRALSEKGEDRLALNIWMEHQAILQQDQHALEEVAWATLRAGAFSGELRVRSTALIAAALTRDVRAIPLLVRAMRDSSALLRLMAVRLAELYPDLPVQQELERLLREEKIWFVRAEVIRMVGKLRICSSKQFLKEMILQPNLTEEEQGEAIIALVQIYDAVRSSDLISLLSSDRAERRRLGSELIVSFEIKDWADRLVPLLNDHSPQVRLAAIDGLSWLKVSLDEKLSLSLMEDSSPMVAIAASAMALLEGKEEGLLRLKAWMHDSNPELRRIAATRLIASGPAAVSLAIEEMESNDDLFVSANLAWGLIGQRVAVKEAAEVLYQFLLKSRNSLLMWDQHGHLHLLSSSKVAHLDHIPCYPQWIDQKVRLDLLNLLSIVAHPAAQESVREYIASNSFSITRRMVSLFAESGEEITKIISSFLEDGDPYIQVQAALALSTRGRDPALLEILERGYHSMPREVKMDILEAIGEHGSSDSIPFLVTLLGEFSETIRLVAASAIVQSLYH